jgi:hypothetical protein
MGARGDFRHDAAKGRVFLDLAEHDVGQDHGRAVARSARRRRGGLVAARLDAENAELASLAPVRLPGSALSPMLGGVGTSARVRAGLSRTGAMQTVQTPERLQDRNARQRAGAGPGARDAGAADGGARLPEEAFAIEVISTSGDRIQDRPAVGGRRQGPVHQGDRGGAARRPHRHRRAFLQGHADALPAGLELSAFLPREDPRDAFIGGRRRRSRICRRARRSARRRCAARR